IASLIVSGSMPIPASASWNDTGGVRWEPDDPLRGVESESTGGVASATVNVHSAAGMAFPERSETVTFTWWLPYARPAPGTSAKRPAAYVPAAATSEPSRTTCSVAGSTPVPVSARSKAISRRRASPSAPAVGAVEGDLGSPVLPARPPGRRGMRERRRGRVDDGERPRAVAAVPGTVGGVGVDRVGAVREVRRRREGRIGPGDLHGHAVEARLEGAEAARPGIDRERHD